MFSRSTPEPPPAAPASAETRFSLPELRKLHKQLVENKRVNDNNQNLVVEILRVIAEMVVYGDNKSELLFDFFCEKNMLSLFLEIMATPGGCPSAVHIQILQTLSILISCVRNETSLYYLLSNNYVNEIINYPHDFMIDESLCAQFASFMKTLSLKLNIHTVQFFFIEETGAFPILTRAVELLTIPDPMIRIASQSTILNVYRVEDSRARAYALQDEVMGIMFAQTVNFMENQYHTIFKTCKMYYKACNAGDEEESGKMERKIDDILSSMEDWFYYLQDLLDLDVPILRKALVHQLIHDFLLPVLLGPLLKHHSVYMDEEKSKQRAGRANHCVDYLFKSEERASDRGRLSLVLDDVQFEIYDNIELIASLSYLLQMLKIVTHPALQRAVLVTIFHPLSLDCRMQILRELEGAHSSITSGSSHGHGHHQQGHHTGSNGSLDTTPVKGSIATHNAHNSVLTPSTSAAAGSVNTAIHTMTSPSVTTTPTPASITTTLTSNHIKVAWDRLHQQGSQKVALLMMYIEHILLERIVSTAVDCFPGNEGNITIEEEYISTYPAITPLRMVSDPRSDAILMLQWLHFLPNREHCDAYVTSAAVARSLNLSSQPCSPAPTVRKSLANQATNDNTDDSISAFQVSGIAVPSSDQADLWSSNIHLDEPDSPVPTSTSDVAINLIADCDAEAAAASNNNNSALHTSESVSFKTAQNTSSDSLDGLALPSTHPDLAHGENGVDHGVATEGIAAGLPTSTSNSNLHPDSFISPAASKRIKLGRNDMLLPAESTMGVGLNSADQLMLTALRRLDDVYTEKIPFYPEIVVKYSVDPMFQVLSESHNYSVTTIQVAAHAVYSLCLLLASTRPLPAVAPRASFSSLARSSLSLLSNTVGSVGGAVASGVKVVSPGGFNNNNNSNNSKSNGSSKNNSKANSFSEPNQALSVPSSTNSVAVQPEYALRNRSDINQCLLDYCFVRVREAGKLAAMKLLVRLEGTMAEMMLNVIREEIARSEGQKWRRCIERMYQDVLLFLPATQFSSERMGIDFDLPVSQVETIRKEVQAFLVVRALHRQLATINSSTLPCPETETADNLYSSITDKGFLCLEEKNLLPANCTVGSPFDMRGKRFLEVRLVPVQQKTSVDGVSSPLTGGLHGTGTPDQNGSRTHSPNRNSGSMWGLNTKRLFGSSSSSSNHAHTSTSHVNSPASSVPGAPGSSAASVVVSNDPILRLVTSKSKVLFVQDNKNLYLVTCEKPDSRSGFKVLIAAPLLYTDAQMDPHDVHKFRLTVRSQREVEYMYSCEPDLTQLYREGGADTLLASQPGVSNNATASAAASSHPSELTPTHSSSGNLAALNGTKSNSKATTNGGYAPHTKFVAPKIESSKFLKPRGKTNFFTLTVRVDSELACRLAVQHIENKRKEQAEAKIAQFQHILEHWSSEHDINVNEH